MKNNKRVTQLEIARKARVSQSTVSFVLNNRFTDRVSDETRKKISNVARDLGYRTNYFARSLVLGKTNSIGFIYEDSFEFLTHDPFCSSIFIGINQEINRRRLNLVFATFNFTQQNLPPMLDSYLAEGILVLGSKNKRLPNLLRERGIPHIFIDPFYKETRSPSMMIDNEKCVIALVDHLVKIGHKKIGMVVPSADTGDIAWSFQERINGFKHALTKNNLPLDPDLIVMSEYDIMNSFQYPDLKPGFEGGKKLMQMRDRPSAIFAANDRVALGVLKAASELGLSVPKDVSVIGFDDLEFAKTTQPPLTTINIDKESLGKRSVELLLDILQGDNVTMERFGGQLTVRESTASL